MNQIVINIDDYGMYAEADEKIIRLLGMGLASSVSVMVTSERFPKAKGGKA